MGERSWWLRGPLFAVMTLALVNAVAGRNWSAACWILVAALASYRADRNARARDMLLEGSTQARDMLQDFLNAKSAPTPRP